MEVKLKKIVNSRSEKRGCLATDLPKLDWPKSFPFSRTMVHPLPHRASTPSLFFLLLLLTASHLTVIMAEILEKLKKKVKYANCDIIEKG